MNLRVLVLIAASCVFLSSSTSANLLTNGSFEGYGQAHYMQPDGIPGWTYWEDYPYDGDGTANGAPYAQHPLAETFPGTMTGPDYPRDGDYCLIMWSDRGTWRAFMYQEISVTPGMWYWIEGYGCLSGGGISEGRASG